MFNKGTWKGLIANIPKGGQNLPISKLGARLLLKKAQKKEKKNKTSDVINRIIPHCIPLKTELVWYPWKDLSREISRHHWAQINKQRINLKNLKIQEVLIIHETVPIKVPKTDTPIIKGHGLGNVRWKGWCWKIIGC